VRGQGIVRKPSPLGSAAAALQGPVPVTTPGCVDTNKQGGPRIPKHCAQTRLGPKFQSLKYEVKAAARAEGI
jgi:hypothetical protein